MIRVFFITICHICKDLYNIYEVTDGYEKKEKNANSFPLISNIFCDAQIKIDYESSDVDRISYTKLNVVS